MNYFAHIVSVGGLIENNEGKILMVYSPVIHILFTKYTIFNIWSIPSRTDSGTPAAGYDEDIL